MGSPIVGLDLICVQLLRWRPGIRKPNRVGPLNKVSGGGCQNVPAPVPEAAMILTVLPPERVPESQVLRIESRMGSARVDQDTLFRTRRQGALGDDRLRTGKREANSIRRLQPIEPQRVYREDDGFVSGVGWTGGIVVLENGCMAGVQPHPRRAVLSEHDVVAPGARELDHPELGFGPVNPVLAFGVTEEVRVGLGDFVAHVVLHAPVIHPVEIPVPEYRTEMTRVAFPRRIGHDCHFTTSRGVQTLCRAA